MDLSKVEYFLKAAELENFTKAAEECNIAQTTMSKYISTLEKEIGCTLFQRNNKKVVLTEQGQKFYNGITEINKSYQKLLQDIVSSVDGGIHLGIAIQDYLEIPVLQKFEKTFPDIPIYFSFGQDAELIDILESGKVDALVIPDALKIPDGYEYCTILRMRQSIVCSKSMVNRFETVGSIISNMPLITKSDNPDYHEKCQENFRQIFGVTSPQIIVCKTLSEQLLNVGMSKGFAILPYSGGSTFEGLTTLPLGDDFRENTQLVFSKSVQSDSLKKLLKFIYEEKCL